MITNLPLSSLHFCLLQVSITFDPFLYLPVPLPQKQKVLSVFYYAKEPHKKPIKVSLLFNGHTPRVVVLKCGFMYTFFSVSHDPLSEALFFCTFVFQFLVSVSKENSSTAEVLESISRSVRVKPENLRLAEV